MSVNCDSIPLMKQLAAMAKMDASPIKRMVLVLDVDCAPMLFVESFIDDTGDKLADTPLIVSEEPVFVDTTTMQNQKFRTKAPLKSEG